MTPSQARSQAMVCVCGWEGECTPRARRAYVVNRLGGAECLRQTCVHQHGKMIRRDSARESLTTRAIQSVAAINNKTLKRFFETL